MLYGGLDASDHTLADTWEFDGQAWRQVPTLDAPQTGLSAEPGLSEHALAFDHVSGKVLLFGGSDGVQDSGGTWAYDGQNWLQLAAAASPYPRHGHALVYDAQRQQLLLFGGEHAGLNWRTPTSGRARPGNP